ncbi:MAG: hypothetical protein ACHQC8_02535 [Solirubrobacterales bacterium]
MDERMMNQAPKGKQQIPITQELIQRVAALVGGGGGVGLFPAQNDILAFPDDCDATHPYNFDFVLPSNFQKMLSARLSWKLRPYRTFSTLTLSATGAGTAHHHTVGGESGHSHGHTHTTKVANAVGAGSVFVPAANTLGANTGADQFVPTSSDSTGSSGHTHGNSGDENAHTHSVSGTTVLGIAEDAAPVNPGITIAIDGTDFTSALGGPFNTDVLELDIRPYLPKAVSTFHTLALQPNQRCRVHGILRLSYNVQPGLS